MNDEDPYSTQQRRRHEAARRRLRASQREDLLAAARLLIPDHGLAVPLAWIAVSAGLSRHTARALFNTTAELATALIHAAWHALIEHTAPTSHDTPQHFVARLINAIRNDTNAHRIHAALACGATQLQRETIAHAEAQLAYAIGHGLREAWPALGAPDAATLGRRVLAFSRSAALDPAQPDTLAEAAAIIAMLAARPLAAAHSEAAPAAYPSAAPTPVPSTPRSADAVPVWVSPAPRLPANIAAVGRARVHDPPARAA